MNLLVMNLTVSAVEKNDNKASLQSWDPTAGQERLMGAGGMEQPCGEAPMWAPGRRPSGEAAHPAL